MAQLQTYTADLALAREAHAGRRARNKNAPGQGTLVQPTVTSLPAPHDSGLMADGHMANQAQS